MQSNVKIAITGGIGSGKTTVSRIIKKLGLPVISCDYEYELLLRSKDFVLDIAKEFNDVLTESGKLDREELARQVFEDSGKLKRLNSLTHPKIMSAVLSKANRYPICFCEVPLLFEGGYDKYFDKIFVVLRDRSERIKCVMKRDNLSESVVKSRLINQFDYDNNDFAQYYVIHNNGGFHDLDMQVRSVLQELNLLD